MILRPPLGGAADPANRDGFDPSRIHIPVSHATVDCGVYVDGGRLPGRYTHAAAQAKVSELTRENGEAFVWIGLHEPDEHQMRSVADAFGLHPLLVRGAVHTHSRPKLERYDDTLVLVLKTVDYVEHDDLDHVRHFVETGEVMIAVGADFVLTVRHGDHRGLADVREQMQHSPAILKLGPYAVMHAIAEHVVDGYRFAAELLEADIDALQSNVFSPTVRTDVEPLYLLKREIAELCHAVSPSTTALGTVETDHGDLISVEVRRYMRAVLERHLQAADRIVSYDEMMSTLIEAALGKIALQQNSDMRKISAWVALAAVPTLVAGIYGMNFDAIPLEHSPWGYPVVMTAVLCVCLVLYRNFRRRRWL
jgi:magnesium transporter